MLVRWVPTAVVLVSTIASAPAWAEGEAAAPPPASAAPAPPPEAPSKKLTVGTEGTFQPGLLLQGWFLRDSADKTTSTFRLRRAELHVKGDIIPKLVSYAVMIDPAQALELKDTTLTVANQDPAPSDATKPESVTAKQPVSGGRAAIFQDFFITYKHPFADVSFGQFKIPVSWEGYNSSSKLLFAERAAVSRQFGDKRDLGLRIAKGFGSFGYSAGLFNGAGQNNLDTNNAKDVALRLEAYPIKGLVLAGMAYASLWRREAPGAKDRYEADLRYEGSGLIVQAEYIRARDVDSKSAVAKGEGFYTALAYSVSDEIQPCVRIGKLNPDVEKPNDDTWHYDVGLNYYLRQHEAKLQLNYYRFAYHQKKAKNEIILAAQVSY